MTIQPITSGVEAIQKIQPPKMLRNVKSFVEFLTTLASFVQSCRNYWNLSMI